MKVSKSSVSTSYRSSAASSAYGKTQKAQESTSLDDSIEVSPSAALFQKAVDSSKNVPDIRTNAISGIQKEFQDGSYYRDETEVADKVITDYLTSP